MKLSIVIPLLNESKSLNELHSLIKAVLIKNKYTYEIIFIDDGSTDNSVEVLKKLKSKDKNIKILTFRKNFGKASALAAGFREAKNEYIVTMDADLQDDPKEIPNLINKLKEGYDLVSGWKYKRYDPISKVLPSRIFNFIVSIVTGTKLHDVNCGLKIYKNEVIKSLDIYGSLHRFIPALAKVKGFKVTEIKIRHHKRKYGKTKYGPARFFNGILDLFTVIYINKFIKKPLHFFGTLGIILFFIGFPVLVFILVTWINHGNIRSHYPLTLFGILMVLMGTQFISLGLLGEMISNLNISKCEYEIKKQY